MPTMEQIRTETLLHLGRNLRSTLDSEALDLVSFLFDEMIRNGIEKRGYRWEEPFRSFVLHHIGKIGRRADARAQDGVITGSILEQATNDVSRLARAALSEAGVKEPMMGSICGLRP